MAQESDIPTLMARGNVALARKVQHDIDGRKYEQQPAVIVIGEWRSLYEEVRRSA